MSLSRASSAIAERIYNKEFHGLEQLVRIAKYHLNLYLYPTVLTVHYILSKESQLCYRCRMSGYFVSGFNGPIDLIYDVLGKNVKITQCF